MVKTSPSNAVGIGSIPGQGAKILYALWPKDQNIKQKQYVTYSINTLKIVHIKKKYLNLEINHFHSWFYIIIVYKCFIYNIL